MIFGAIADGKAQVVLPFVDKYSRNVTVHGTCYLYLLNEVVWFPFRSSATRKGTTGGCRTLPRHTAWQKLKVFLSKNAGAEWLTVGPRSDGPTTRPISTSWISIFGHWPTRESMQQSHLQLLKWSILSSSLSLKAAKMCWRMLPWMHWRELALSLKVNGCQSSIVRRKAPKDNWVKTR